MNGLTFERECAAVMRRVGFKARWTGRGPDEGVDIVAEKDDIQYAVQCKAWKTGKVGRPDVQRLAGVIAIGDCDKGIFISLNGLTEDAADAAQRAGILCWDVDDLVRMVTPSGKEVNQ